MKERTAKEIHWAADRVALEAARRVKDEGQAERYIAVYEKVRGYLCGVFEKTDIED